MRTSGESGGTRAGRGTVALVAGAAVAVFALAVVGPVLGDDWGFEFIYDDHRFVERNEEIETLDPWKFLTDPRTVDPGDDWKGIYRPLRTFSFAVDHAFWGLRPVGYHLQNVLWHALASVCLLLLLVRLGVGRVPATLASLVFAVHPVQAESVVWITSRGDVMSGALALAALAVHAGGRAGRGRVLAVAGLGFLAMLAKEVAIGLPAAIVIIDVVVRRPWKETGARTSFRRHSIRAWLPVALAALGYLVLRQSIMAAYDDRGGHLDAWWGGSWAGQLVVSARGFLLHVASILFPVGARLDYYPPTHGTIDPGAATGILLLVAILVVVAVTWRRRPIVATGLLLFLLFLFPTSSVLVTVGIPSADRFLYLPLAGIALALTPLANRVPIAATAVVLLAVITVPESTKYASDETLWAAGSVGSPRALVDVARRKCEEVDELWDSGEKEKAREVIPEAKEMCHAALDRWRVISGSAGVAPMFHTHLRLANLHRLEGDRRKSFDSLKRAELNRPGHALLRYHRSWLLRDMGDRSGALRDLLGARETGFRAETTIPLREQIARLLNELAREEIDAGSFGWAMLHLQRSLEEWPGDAGNDAGKLLAPLREEMRRRRAEPDPAEDDLQGWLERGRLFGQFGRWPDARFVLLGLSNRLKRDPTVMVTLARWGFEEAGEAARAAELYARAASIDPRNEEALMGLVRCDGYRLDPLLRSSPDVQIKMLERLPDDDARVLVLLARANRAVGRQVAARSLLEKASKGRGPGVIDALEDLWDEDHVDR